MNMKKLLTIGAAGLIAIAASLSAATPSSADPAGDAIGAGIVGGIFGFMAGAAAASGAGPHYHHRVYVEDDYALHVRACERAYGWRYDEGSDTYRARNGRRYYCDL
jgi:hypothetical protein